MVPGPVAAFVPPSKPIFCHLHHVTNKPAACLKHDHQHRPGTHLARCTQRGPYGFSSGSAAVNSTYNADTARGRLNTDELLFIYVLWGVFGFSACRVNVSSQEPGRSVRLREPAS